MPRPKESNPLYKDRQKKRVSFYVDVDVLKLLKDDARINGRTCNSHINFVIKKGLGENEKIAV